MLRSDASLSGVARPRPGVFMPKTPKQKLKLLYLAKMFWEESDEAHPLRIPDMIAYLEANGISAERKSLYDDLEQLQLFGLDLIPCGGGRSAGWFLGSRVIEPHEALLLMEAVGSARFLTPGKSEDLIRRIGSLLSRGQAAEAAKSVSLPGRPKSGNEAIYQTVDRLESAVREDRRISFQYYERDSEGRRVLRRGGHTYRVSPYHLIWDNENYYLIGYDEERGAVRHFRVDRMKIPQLGASPRLGKELFSDFDLARYTRRFFSMYGGREERVTLFCRPDLIGPMLDRFGEVPLRKRPDGVEFTVPVALSPAFYSYLTLFGSGVRIVEPEEVREGFRAYLNEVLSSYEGFR